MYTHEGSKQIIIFTYVFNAVFTLSNDQAIPTWIYQNTFHENYTFSEKKYIAISFIIMIVKRHIC